MPSLPLSRSPTDPKTPEKRTSLLNPNADPYSGGRAHFMKITFPQKEVDCSVRTPPVQNYGSNFTHPFAVSVGRYTCQPNEYQAATLYFQARPVVEYYDARAQVVPWSSSAVLCGMLPEKPESWMKRNKKLNNGGVAVKKWVPKRNVGPPALKKINGNRGFPYSKAKTMSSPEACPRRCIIPFPEDNLELERSNITTVMIKNIPNQFRRVDLVRMLANYCKFENGKADSRSEFDFVYLPMDFRKYWDEKKVANLGYAFVNFTTTTAASLFFKNHHMRDWGVLKNNKICQVTCAKIQGREALCESLKSKVFNCHTDEYLPLVLQPPCDGSFRPRGKIIGKRWE